jgi:hypothetical protein
VQVVYDVKANLKQLRCIRYACEHAARACIYVFSRLLTYADVC